MRSHERREHEQAPHAVDDARDGCEQLDRDAIGPRLQRGAISVRNRAMPMLTGTAMINAIADVTSVPTMGTNAPK